jgi:hypothetical protein
MVATFIFGSSKFKMCMMFSKHGLWNFVDGNATLLSEELAIVIRLEERLY